MAPLGALPAGGSVVRGEAHGGAPPRVGGVLHVERHLLRKRTTSCFAGSKTGLDHGVGHPLLLLYDAKTSRGQKVNEFNGLGDNALNASVSLF